MNRKLTTLRRIILSGIVNFFRNFSLSVAAIAVMVVTLTIVLFSWVTNVTLNNTVQQITTKIDVSVFLQDNITTQQVSNLLSEIKSLPGVSSVQYLDQAQVLKQYIAQNSGNKQLSSAISQVANPLPPTMLIKPSNLNQISSIKNFLVEPSIAALQSSPPSYSGDEELAINKITHATDILKKVGIVAVVSLAIVSALIIFNTIQMAIFNRRSEIQIMRLLGANSWFIRGPFVVESIVYGILAGVISVLIIFVAFKVAAKAFEASALGLLNIGYAHSYFSSKLWFEILPVQLMLGILIGAFSSIIATRRYLKLKKI